MIVTYFLGYWLDSLSFFLNLILLFWALNQSGLYYFHFSFHFPIFSPVHDSCSWRTFLFLWLFMVLAGIFFLFPLLMFFPLFSGFECSFFHDLSLCRFWFLVLSGSSVLHRIGRLCWDNFSIPFMMMLSVAILFKSLSFLSNMVLFYGITSLQIFFLEAPLPLSTFPPTVPAIVCF